MQLLVGSTLPPSSIAYCLLLILVDRYRRKTISNKQYVLEESFVIAEQVRRQVNVRRLELFDKLGADTGWLHASHDFATLDAGLLEDEHVLHDDDVAFHALYFRDRRELARSVLKARLLDNQFYSGRYLLTYSLHRQ